MVDVWPATLPQVFERNGYSEGFPDNLIESQPDQGPPTSRRRGTSAPWPVVGSILMTLAQKNELREFFNTTLMSGALPFSFPVQASESSPTEYWLVKFPKGSLPSASELTYDLWRVQLSLIVLP